MNVQQSEEDESKKRLGKFISMIGIIMIFVGFISFISMMPLKSGMSAHMCAMGIFGLGGFLTVIGGAIHAKASFSTNDEKFYQNLRRTGVIKTKKLKKMRCPSCGAKLNPHTMECEYCKNKYYRE